MHWVLMPQLSGLDAREEMVLQEMGKGKRSDQRGT
jgi:hypothetical protein